MSDASTIWSRVKPGDAALEPRDGLRVEDLDGARRAEAPECFREVDVVRFRRSAVPTDASLRHDAQL
ncbi:MAG: hypothetical protein AAFY46_04405, partial [Planctomycetota bacterium]